MQQHRVATIQSPGGTGPCAWRPISSINIFPRPTVWCSRPTWVNHPKIFEAAGLRGGTYAYLDAAARGVDFPALLESLQQLPAGDVVVLHGCCHNPSGVDPTPDQWRQIAQVLAERQLLPLLDFAYQGFGDGLEADAVGLRTVAEAVDELLVASSFSKNFGLYRERVGALSVVAQDAGAGRGRPQPSEGLRPHQLLQSARSRRGDRGDDLGRCSASAAVGSRN